MAREHDLMDSLALFLGKDGTKQEFLEIAGLVSAMTGVLQFFVRRVLTCADVL